MPNKVCNAPFDQIPHIVLNHPETNPEHKEIMRALYKILKDVERPIIYSNEAIANQCRIPLRTVERRLPELVKMGFISSKGRGYNRKIQLGILFANSANMAVGSDEFLTNTAKLAVGNEQTSTNSANLAVEADSSLNNSAKSDLFNRQYGGDYKNYTKKKYKRDASFSSLTHSEKKEIQYCLENGFALAEEFKYLQPFLDECLQ